MRNFAPMIEDAQANNDRFSINVRLALHQAGVLCRGCGIYLTGTVAETLGRCEECRPDDVAAVLDLGCPGVGDYPVEPDHVPSASGDCRDCGLPLPEWYRHALAAKKR